MKKTIPLAATALIVVAAASLHRSGGHRPQVTPSPVGPSKVSTSEILGVDAVIPLQDSPAMEAMRLAAEAGRRRDLVMDAESQIPRIWQEVEESGSTDDLADCLSAEDVHVRLGAAELLGFGRPEGAAAALSTALEKESEAEVRRAMVEGLVKLEDEDAVPALLILWTRAEEEPAMRRLALLGLATLGHAAAFEAMNHPRLGDSERRMIECGLTRALVLRGPADARIHGAVYLIAINSPNESARLDAEEALARVR